MAKWVNLENCNFLCKMMLQSPWSTPLCELHLNIWLVHSRECSVLHEHWTIVTSQSITSNQIVRAVKKINQVQPWQRERQHYQTMTMAMGVWGGGGALLGNVNVDDNVDNVNAVAVVIVVSWTWLVTGSFDKSFYWLNRGLNMSLTFVRFLPIIHVKKEGTPVNS